MFSISKTRIEIEKCLFCLDFLTYGQGLFQFKERFKEPMGYFNKIDNF
jgi:hypothetical protein